MTFTSDAGEINRRIEKVLSSAPKTLPVHQVYPWRRSAAMWASYQQLLADLESQRSEKGCGAAASARRLVAVYGTDLATLIDQWLPTQDPDNVSHRRAELREEIARRDRPHVGYVHRKSGHYHWMALQRWRDSRPGMRQSVDYLLRAAR